MNQTREEKFEATIVEAFPSGLPSFVDLSNVERNNIILEKYLKLGDLVVMHMDKEARGWALKVYLMARSASWLGSAATRTMPLGFTTTAARLVSTKVTAWRR